MRVKINNEWKTFSKIDKTLSLYEVSSPDFIGYSQEYENEYKIVIRLDKPAKFYK